MRLSVRIPLLIGAVVLITSSAIILAAEAIAAGNLRKVYINELSVEARSNTEIIKAKLDNQRNAAWELANRASTRSMDWEGVVRPNLTADVARLGIQDIGFGLLDGTARYVMDSVVTNVGDRDYFQQAAAGNTAVSDMLISKATGGQVVLTSAPIRQSVDPNAPVIGVLFTRQTAQTFSDLIAGIKISHESGYAVLMNRSGTVVAHPDSKMVEDQVNPVTKVNDDPSLRSWADMTSRALRELNGVASYELNGEKKICAFAEIPGYPWLLFVTAEEGDFESEIIRMRNIMLAIGIGCVLAGIIIAVITGLSIAKPITRVAAALKDISEGEGDLTRKLEISGKGEIGDMAHFFNLTLEKIRNLIVKIKFEGSSLSEIGRELAGNMTETAAAINQINHNIQSIKGRMVSQSASVTESHATMEQITGNINKLNGQVENQNFHISRASSAIEEMMANIQSVTGTLVNNSGNVKILEEASENGRTGLQDVATDIQEIIRESEGLLEINTVMENIASQTNLLSMNAAIEAAHAGEAGKGFAVVADEIRKLAESSGEQSKTIGTVLKKIKQSIDKISDSTGNVLAGFEAIDKGVRVVSDQEENLRSAMEEQAAGSKQILEGIGQVNELARHVKSGSTEMLEGAKEVIEESKNLGKATEEITSGINEMASGAGEINTSVNQINDLCGKNRDGIDVLMEEVSRFKV